VICEQLDSEQFCVNGDRLLLEQGVHRPAKIDDDETYSFFRTMNATLLKGAIVIRLGGSRLELEQKSEL
jgi:hypothetical protein